SAPAPSYAASWPNFPIPAVESFIFTSSMSTRLEEAGEDDQGTLGRPRGFRRLRSARATTRCP
ncbi:MAG: hypothetical protein ACREA0_35310, partial [bacterium]